MKDSFSVFTAAVLALEPEVVLWGPESRAPGYQLTLTGSLTSLFLTSLFWYFFANFTANPSTGLFVGVKAVCNTLLRFGRCVGYFSFSDTFLQVEVKNVNHSDVIFTAKICSCCPADLFII